MGSETAEEVEEDSYLRQLLTAAAEYIYSEEQQREIRNHKFNEFIDGGVEKRANESRKRINSPVPVGLLHFLFIALCRYLLSLCYNDYGRIRIEIVNAIYRYKYL